MWFNNLAFWLYRRLRAVLGPINSLHLKNFLQRLLETRARAAGLRITNSEVLLPPSATEKTVFVVAPGSSLNLLTESQWSHVERSFSIGLGGALFHRQELDRYLTEYPPLLHEILRGGDDSARRWSEFGLSKPELIQRLPLLRMKLVPSCIWNLSEHRRALNELGISGLPHLKLRYLPDSDAVYFTRFVKKLAAGKPLPRENRASRFPQTSSTLPSIVLLACLAGCAEVVLLGADLSDEYFSPILTSDQENDLKRQGLHSVDQRNHITEGGTHLEEWQTVSAQLTFLGEVFPSTSVCIGTTKGPLTLLLPAYQWP